MTFFSLCTLIDLHLKTLLPDHPLCVREEQDDVGDKCEGPRRPGSSRPPSAPPPLPVNLRPTSAWGNTITYQIITSYDVICLMLYTKMVYNIKSNSLFTYWLLIVLVRSHIISSTAVLSDSPSGMIKSAHQAPPSVSLESWHHVDSTVNDVNIPISPLPARTNRELLYTELDLQDPHSAVRGNSLQLRRPKEHPDLTFPASISLTFSQPLHLTASPLFAFWAYTAFTF